MGQLSMATRKELTAAVSERYRASTRTEKARILGRRVKPTIRQLGYPTKNALKQWCLREARQHIFGRRCTTRLKCEGTYSSTSRSSVPILLKTVPPHFGHLECYCVAQREGSAATYGLESRYHR